MVAIARATPTIFSSVLSTMLGSSNISLEGLTRCDISHDVAQLNLAPINNSLTPPTNITPAFVGVAFGVQNYTCTQAGNFT